MAHISTVLVMYGTYQNDDTAVPENGLHLGTRVEVINNQHAPFASLGQTGEVVHYDRDGDMYIKLDDEGEGGVWTVRPSNVKVIP